MSRPRTLSCRLPALAARRLGVLTGIVLIAGLSAGAASAPAATTPMVDLGQASTYAVLSGASVGNTVNAPTAPHTTLRGDLGVTTESQPTGFPPGIVTGIIRVGATATPAHTDLVTAYNEVAGRPGGTALAGDLLGVTLAPGLHANVGAVANTGTVTLDGGGDPNAVFVFKIGGAFTMGAGAQVKLTNGTRASRVFWQVNGAAGIGAGGKFAGTLMALNAIAVGAGTEFNGRALARTGAVALDANEFYSSPPAITIAGGATAMTTDTSPTISGTTDIQAPGLVSVKIADEPPVNVAPSGGAWSVPLAIMPNGTYTVVASVTDGAGNPGSATQQLTIDTVLPIVTLDGGASVTTNDATPTISGTSDVAVDTVIRVAVDTQNLRALVHAGGVWNVRPTTLADGTRTVSASVRDPAGNEGTDSRLLTVDTAPPAVTIAGGATKLTNDPTPEIAGTAAVATGTTVTVTLADETLTALAGAGGDWTVTASALADGPHRVVMSTSDAAGNPASFTQVLTIDTVAPTVAIAGGATRTTSDGDPTIVGTSNAAPGTTVTVSIAGQTMTTLVQPNASWNATPSVVGAGTWSVDAAASDPAGNVGSATQSLTITAPAGESGGSPVVVPPPPPATSDAPATTPTPTPAQTPTATSTTNPAPAGAGTTVAATTVTRNTVQRVKGFTLSISTKVTAPARSRVVATATGSVKIAGVAKAIRLTSATAKIAAGRRATLKLRPSGKRRVAAAAFKKVSKAVAAGTKVTATITIRIVDAAGHRRVVRRTVKLTR